MHTNSCMHTHACTHKLLRTRPFAYTHTCMHAARTHALAHAPCKHAHKYTHKPARNFSSQDNINTHMRTHTFAAQVLRRQREYRRGRADVPGARACRVQPGPREVGRECAVSLGCVRACACACVCVCVCVLAVRSVTLLRAVAQARPRTFKRTRRCWRPTTASLPLTCPTAASACVREGGWWHMSRDTLARCARSLSHGYQTEKKKISAVSVYFETMPYRLNEARGCRQHAHAHTPSMSMLAGAQ
jgi:hypothetical protein